MLSPALWAKDEAGKIELFRPMSEFYRNHYQVELKNVKENFRFGLDTTFFGQFTDAGKYEDYPTCGTVLESPCYVNYEEDIFVGYRYFETIPGAAEKVVFPFGFGLSMTDWSGHDRHAEEIKAGSDIKMSKGHTVQVLAYLSDGFNGGLCRGDLQAAARRSLKVFLWYDGIDVE